MSPLTHAGVLSAADFVRANWTVDPAASRAFAAQLRTNANLRTAQASDNDARCVAAALTHAAVAAEGAVAEMEGR
jgi:hypothetical protein